VAEATMLVCDVCGRPAVETVTIRIGRRNLQKDLCQVHLNELTQGTRVPRPGRPRAVAAQTAKRRGRPPKVASGNGRRRGRPAKTPSGNGRRRGAGRKRSAGKAA
jgi:hypothetical protein